MKIVSVDVPSVKVSQGNQAYDITVVVEHGDGSQGTYLVRSRDDLEAQVRRYVEWSAELAALKAMVQ